MFANTMRPVELPPPPAGTVRSVLLALLLHLLLLAALTWGVRWNQRSQDLAVEAELWSAVPQQAAPKPVEAAPAPPPPVAAPAPAPSVDAQIALERDRQRDARRKQEQEKAARLEQQRRELALQKERDRQKERDKAKALQQQQQRERAAEAQQAARQQAEREQNIRRMLGQAGSSTNPDASGTAARSSGPSASYAGRIRARIKPNIVYTDDTTGNPVAEVEIRVAPDGTIVGRRLLKPSGVRPWDDAVLKAIDKTETLPRDTDGQIPSIMVIVFRPKE